MKPVRVRSPLRISFVGGGSDLPEYATVEPGAVVSTAIGDFVEVLAAPTRRGCTIIAPDLGVAAQGDSWADIAASHPQLAFPCAALRLNGVRTGTVTISATTPVHAGLGGSSSLAVALVAAASAIACDGVVPDARALAEAAFRLERDVMQWPVGRQDAYAAALGGSNILEFAGDNVHAHALEVSGDGSRRLEAALMLFTTPLRGPAADALRLQAASLAAGDADAMRRLRSSVQRVQPVAQLVAAGNVEQLGITLDAAWRDKRGLAGATHPSLDEWYDTALAHGAIGGKVTGAGGRGSILLVVPPECHAAVAAALARPGLRARRVRMGAAGAAVVD